jgi:3-oxoadipate enol-lactonase
MPDYQIQTGQAPINGAQLYYEIAGQGQPVVMIHAGVADCRQWNNEFVHFAGRSRVLRYDLRGYGSSQPVEGEYTNLADLTALLDHLHLDAPLVLIGCSMGGGLAMDFALANPARVRALVMVASGPSGLELDVPSPPVLEEAEQAYLAGDLDRACELEVQGWFIGTGRTREDVDPAMVQLAFDMNRTALAHDASGLGKRRADASVPAAGRLGELTIPVLVILGEYDVPYMHAAAGYMLEHIPTAQQVLIPDAAHLPNMDQPAEFQKIVEAFLDQHAPPGTQ